MNIFTKKNKIKTNHLIIKGTIVDLILYFYFCLAWTILFHLYTFMYFSLSVLGHSDS